MRWVVMSFESRAGKDFLPGKAFDFDALVEASDTVSIPGVKQGPRRRKNARRKIAKASLIAPLLMAEGCLSLGKRDLLSASDDTSDVSRGDAPADVASGAGGGGGRAAAPAGGRVPVNTPPVETGPVTPAEGFAQDDGNFQTNMGATLEIAAADLVANDISANDGNVSLVRVFGATGGAVSLENGVVVFTPDEGFMGAASFQYEVRDAAGQIDQARVEIQVSEHQHQDDHNGDHGENGQHGDDGHGDQGGHGGGEEGHGGGHGHHDNGMHAHPDDPAKAAEHQ
ncbi:MAG: Ig-like domain-containing protein, partial [Hyphococcus sp.]